MGDAIKPTGAPGAKGAEDPASRPDLGFHDDHVGSHLKADEAAKKRAAEGVLQRRPKRLDIEPRQVVEVRESRGSEQDRAALEAGRRQRSLVAGRGPERARPRPSAEGGGPNLQAAQQSVLHIERRVDLLMATLADLEGALPPEEAPPPAAGPKKLAWVPAPAAEQAAARAQAKAAAEQQAQPSAAQAEAARAERASWPEAIADGDGHGRGSEDDAAAEDDGDEEEEARTPEQRWDKAARDMRYLLQHLIAGGVGLALHADPAVTFQRLLDGMRGWPPKVPPGYRPRTAADFDQFLAWVFRPEPLDPGAPALSVPDFPKHE